MSLYSECGEKFRLRRGYGLSGPPSWALIGGSAVHTITEILDLRELGADDPLPTFEEALDAETKRQTERARVKVDAIKATGRASKEWPNKRDRDWWLHHGPTFVQNWVDWKAEADLELLTMPDGMPAIEVSVECEIAGRKSRGYIDRAYVLPTGEVIVVDLKTGKKPSTYLQLGTYRHAFRLAHGIDVSLGAFWLAEKGEMTNPVDLTIFTPEYLENLYAMAWRGIEAGVFMPNTSAYCGSCDVAAWCRAQGGLMVNEIPVTQVSSS